MIHFESKRKSVKVFNLSKMPFKIYFEYNNNNYLSYIDYIEFIVGSVSAFQCKRHYEEFQLLNNFLLANGAEIGERVIIDLAN